MLQNLIGMDFNRVIPICLAAGFAFSLLAAIIYSFLNGMDTDKFPVTLLFDAILLIPLLILIYFGRKLFVQPGNKSAHEAILIVATILVFFPGFFIYRFVQQPHIPYLSLLVLSVVLVVLWLLNVLAFLFPKKQIR